MHGHHGHQGPPGGINNQIAGNFFKFEKWNVPNNWSNPHKVYVPRIEFHKQCKKCHGTGAINYKGAFYPCRKCYKHKGYCVTCYGTGRSYVTGRNCPNCCGHGKYNNQFRGKNHPQGWGEWSDSD